MANEVCDECEPFKCEECKNISSLAFKITTNTAKNEHLLVCHTCLHKFPTCRGCDKSFIQKKKGDSFCANCNQAASDGKCISCEEPSDWLDDRLLCERCAEKPYTSQVESEFTSRHWCTLCEVNEVSKNGEICLSCRSRKIVCPSCHEEFISSWSHMCAKCLRKKYGE